MKRSAGDAAGVDESQEARPPAAKVAKACGEPDVATQEAAAAAASEAEDEFAKVRKNRVACVSLLCRHAQRIERVWEADEALRRALLETFAACLESLASHKDQVCVELSRLAPKVSPASTLRHFLTIVLPIERQHTRGLRDHEFLVLRPDDCSRADASREGVDASACRTESERPLPRPRMPLTVVLDNLRSAFNVGSVFRTAECLRVAKLQLCGYTALPEAGGSGHTGRAAMGADVHVPWEHCEKTSDAVKALRAQGIPVYALETVEGAASVHSFNFPQPCAFLLGNERHGIEADLLSLCTAPVRIPCHGVKNSLNVAVAFAISAYEVARQWHWDGGSQGEDDAPAPAVAAAAAAAEGGASISPA